MIKKKKIPMALEKGESAIYANIIYSKISGIFRTNLSSVYLKESEFHQSAFTIALIAIGRKIAKFVISSRISFHLVLGRNFQ